MNMQKNVTVQLKNRDKLLKIHRVKEKKYVRIATAKAVQ